MDQAQTFSLGLQVGEMLRNFDYVVRKDTTSANGRVVFAALNMIIRGIRSDPNNLAGIGISRPEEAAGTIEQWVKRLVDDNDLPKDLSYDTVVELYSDLELYFGDLLVTVRAGTLDHESKVL